MLIHRAKYRAHPPVRVVLLCSASARAAASKPTIWLCWRCTSNHSDNAISPSSQPRLTRFSTASLAASASRCACHCADRRVALVTVKTASCCMSRRVPQRHHRAVPPHWHFRQPPVRCDNAPPQGESFKTTPLTCSAPPRSPSGAGPAWGQRCGRLAHVPHVPRSARLIPARRFHGCAR